jgi:hypothetical protein
MDMLTDDDVAAARAVLGLAERPAVMPSRGLRSQAGAQSGACFGCGAPAPSTDLLCSRCLDGSVAGRRRD